MGDQIVTVTPLLESVIAISRRAGDAILEVYASAFNVTEKADSSLLTDADLRSEAVILEGLESLGYGIPAVSEEDTAEGRVISTKQPFWLVDPLDGTREFVNRNGEFTVNVALVENGLPVLGVVFAPVLGQLYGGSFGGGAFLEIGGARRPIACGSPKKQGVIVVSSRSHADVDSLRSFLAANDVARSVTVGSSLKFCMIAAGDADVYPRFGPTMEWDTAAGHAVLRAAGGRVADLSGSEIRYGKPGFVNPPFIARGTSSHV